jgi:hypothetical protein
MSFNGDNATSNDKQTETLDTLPNSFHKFNRVRCFNHTMQLSAKALLKPFSGPTTVTDEDDSEVIAASSDDDDDLPALEDLEGDYQDDDNDDEGDDDENNDTEAGEDALETLGAEEREALLENTAVV